MLSQKIRSLRKKFESFLHTGQSIRASQVNRMIATMCACEEQARQLEQSTINPTVQLTQEHLADGKVTLFPIMAVEQRNYSDGDGINGGDAA